MGSFRLGDEVRVVGLPSSQWQNRQGTIVQILEHGHCEQGDIAQECAVDLGRERRWFMAKHLVKTVSAKFLRFFRAEVLDRWHLEPDEVDSLKGDSQGLVDLLCDRLNFSARRAETEAEDFCTEFNEKIARAIDRESSPKPVPLCDKPAEGIQREIPKRTNAA
jgi:hypothetical protein